MHMAQEFSLATRVEEMDDETAADMVEGVAHAVEPALEPEELRALDKVASYLRGESNAK